MLLDINDHYPELPELPAEELQVSEDFKQGHIIKADFTAIDLDDRETANAKINYYIRQISPALARDTDIFALERVDEYSASLKVAQDLKGFHGSWMLQVEACDRGSEYDPIIALPEPAENNCRTRDYEVVVLPFNYNSPTIIYPTRNAQIRLKYESLKNGSTLVDTNGSTLPNFVAVDDDGGIYGHVTFSLRSTNDNENDHEAFRVEKVNDKTGQLVLENDQAVEPFPKNYSITVIARDGGDKQSETSIYIVFINMTGEPAFLQTTFDTDFTGTFILLY
uniref:Cadherin domain-containing protein n=1 Tax=Anopheles culicifacies TaxID=139723 RepID=A0A182MFN8_9DIPT